MASTIPQLIAARIRRREDPALVTGQGKYTADIQLEEMLYMAVVRSSHAHAHIRQIDTSAAQALPGVVAVLTAADLNTYLAQALSSGLGMSAPEYSEKKTISRYPLATETVRWAGEPVAVVVAESSYIAADAVEAVSVDYTPLPVVLDAEQALADGAPLLYEEWGTNLAFRWSKAGGGVDTAFAKAETVIELRVVNQRLIPNALEPRAVVAAYDATADVITLWTTTQVPHAVKTRVAAMLGHSVEKLRVIAPEVGGAFGAKVSFYGEEVVVPWLAKRLGRPVRWVASRQEDYLATSHGRDQIQYIRLAADKAGRVHAADLKIIVNCGAYLSGVMPVITANTGQMMTGVYHIPNARCEALGVVTNKGLNAPYRGAGQPEAAHLIERAMDVLADELGMDPAEIRRKNYIPPDHFPYATPTGARYDTGDYEKTLTRALEVVDYPALRAEQTRRRSQPAPKGGKLLGIGLATYVALSGAVPFESATVLVDQAAKVTVLTGTSPHGQGHETAWAQVVAHILQLPMEDITVKHGDTAVVPRGIGTFGSRSSPVGAGAVWKNTETVRERAKAIAAHLLEAAPADVVLEQGRFQVVGTPGASVGWPEVAKAAHNEQVPKELQGALQADADFSASGEVYPFGTHVCVVELDAESGQVEIVRYIAVDDCGRVINPLLVEGQIHGGLAQGIGQALLEGAVYDEIGNLISGSLIDYALPRADHFPRFESHRTETPTPLNPLGVKGIGEATTIGSTPAVVNAVVDALSHLGVHHLDMPVTPEKIWRALNKR
jgi:carbon-monoxide dehydrogenase large subunit